MQALKFEAKPKSNSTERNDPHSHSRLEHTRHKKSKPETASPTHSDVSAGRLADFLIARAVANPHLGTALYWYLMVETEDRLMGKMYARVAYQFQTKLMERSDGQARRNMLKRQGELVALLSTKAKEIRASKDTRPKKIDKLKHWIMDPKQALSPLSAPLSIPLDPSVKVVNLVAERSTVFKSNLFPLLLWFEQAADDEDAEDDEHEAQWGQDSMLIDGNINDGIDHGLRRSSSRDTRHRGSLTSPSGGEPYPIMFKNGDDLRQDQLVIQLFTLMDRLLRKENLDLKLSPYAVLATGSTEGMIQFVRSKSLAGIMGEYGSLLNYLKVEYADEGAIGTYGVEPAVLDTFVRSCGEFINLE